MSGIRFGWDPEEVDAFFARLFGMAPSPRYALQEAWQPAVDVYELEDRGLMVIAELPGVREADLEVTLQPGRLRIAGVRRAPDVRRCRGPVQLEIQFGPFERWIPVPADVDADDIQAHFRHGLLAVHVPRARRSRSVRIEVERPETS